jgi:outer membrane protein TolC
VRLAPPKAVRATLAVALVGSALAGCGGGGLSKPQLSLPAAFQGDQDADVTLRPDSLDSWWRLYDDAQLTALVEEALRNSPDARTGLQRIAQARATRAQTLSAYLPQGDLVGEAQDQYTSETMGGGLGVTTGLGTTSSAGSPGSSTSSVGSGASLGATTSSATELTTAGALQTYAASYNISYELDLFGRQRAARRAANADVAAQRFDYEATRSTLATNVASALFQARGDAIQLADARETARIADELARASDVSAAHGLTATSDAARLESEAATDRAEVARLEGVARAARRTLLDLVGRGTAPLETLVVEPTAVAPPLPPAITPGELLRRRPDVREAEARLRSATWTLKLDKLQLFPDFDIAPGFELAKTAGSFASLTTIWTAGLNATMPILSRPRLLDIIRGQRAIGEQAVIAYEKAVQDAYRDAENGLNTLDSDRKRVAQLKLAVDRARFAFDAKRRGYDLGLVDLTTLLDAEVTWRTNRSTLTGAEVQGLVDSATLFQALGGGWSPPTAKLATLTRVTKR